MSFFDVHEEWGLVELPDDDSLPSETLELLVLHELAHGMLKMAGGDKKSWVTEATCNRIARLARGDFITPLGNEHTAAVQGAEYYEIERKDRAELPTRLGALPPWLSLVIDGLPDIERQVVNLIYWEGLSLRAAAQVLGVSQTHVARWRDSALVHLGEHFAALDKAAGDE